MKTVAMPSVEVGLDFLEKAKRVLRDGETLQALVARSVRAEVRRREVHQSFLARGLASRERAAQGGNYIDASDVVAKLEGILKDRE